MKIYLVSGDDPSLLSKKVRDLVGECVGDQSSDMVLTQLEETDYETEDGFSISPLIAAAESPPMFEPFRVVEARNLGLFSTGEDLTGLLNYLEAPLETTSLVLVWEKGIKQTRLSPLNKKLKDAVIDAEVDGQKIGEVVTASKPRGAKGTRDWFAKEVAAVGLKLDSQALELLQNHLGEDFSRLSSLLETISSAFGDSERLSSNDIVPFLGSAGSVPVWELTAALSKGDGAGSIKCIHRKLGAGEHPIAILSFLVNHYMRIARLDGAGFKNSDEVAKALGMSAYPAKLALEESRNLGPTKIKKIIELLGSADYDLKGKTGLDGKLVLEILAARIAQQYRLKN